MASASVSYETYAPRSSSQLERLSRIAELTAGPSPDSSSNSSTAGGKKKKLNSKSSVNPYGSSSSTTTSGSSSSSSSSSGSLANMSLLMRAMCPEPFLAVSHEDGSSKNNKGSHNNIATGQKKKKTSSDVEDEIAAAFAVNAASDDPVDDMHSSFLFSRDDDDSDDMDPTTSNAPTPAPAPAQSKPTSVKGAFAAPSARNVASIRRAGTVSSQAASSLRNCIETSTQVQSSLRQITTLTESLSQRHAELVQHSGEVSTACERLQNEEAVLSKHASAIGAPLKHYDAVDSIGVKVGVLFKEGRVVRGLARVKVDSEDYIDVLDKIDEAMAFFIAPHGEGALAAEGKEYGRRALALHEAALFLIKEAVVDRVNQAATDIAAALNMPKKILPADKLEASLVYTRFHGISSRSNHLLQLLQERIHKAGGYRELMDMCQFTYCKAREHLLKPTVNQHMEHLREQHGLVGMTRLASVFLMRLCSVETGLYLDFFGVPPTKQDGEDAKAVALGKKKSLKSSPASTQNNNNTSSSTTSTSTTSTLSKNKPSNLLDDEPFQRMLGSLCSCLHRTVRRGVVQLSDMDLLCQVVGVLREERSTANAQAATRATARAISAVIEDAQERLIFCTQLVLQKEVIKFKPSVGDLDYPNKLMGGAGAGAGGASAGAGAGAGADATPAASGDAVQAQLKVYEAWFPPMRSVLRILSKIFRVVEPRVFEDIALQAVQACTKTLKEAAVVIGGKSGEVHSDLFLVKHLLILREQLSPFDIQLRAVEKQLDFSEAGRAVTKFLANRNRRIFSISRTDNALVTLLREGVSVQESSVDSKRDLEDALRSACNDFMEHISRNVSWSLLEFVAQGKAAISADSTSALKSGSLMRPDNIVHILTETKDLVTAVEEEAELRQVKKFMAIYLESVATQTILLKPVSRKIVRALEDVKGFIAEVDDGKNGWTEEVRGEVLGLVEELEKDVKREISAGTGGGGAAARK